MHQDRSRSELHGRLRSSYSRKRLNTEHGCRLRPTRHAWPRRLNSERKCSRSGKLHPAAKSQPLADTDSRNCSEQSCNT